ncbi:MAG: xanthine dehydrogenase small subunit [Albidovulum sp.]|nr:xanthine dehydrogenase small subunit [Albidovulum sp.]MDE0305075.1 xanthine dehydrogenase small subunit [Albidovulum sp.]MDE0533537.1 xanthine dehydrogenase small subunit [Albidovulum sp.]
MTKIHFRVNGREVSVNDVEPTATLLDWLREEQGLTGTKEGCNEGDCGACTVMVSHNENGRMVRGAVNSCLFFLPQMDGKDVRTVEGIAELNGSLHPVQEAMIANHGSQCGFCTPGIIMSMAAAHSIGDRLHDDVLAGNLCRCTGYAPIVKAAESAAGKPVPEWIRDEPPPRARGESVETNRFLVARNLNELAEWYESNPDAVVIGGATDVGLWVTKKLREIEKACFAAQVPELSKIEVANSFIEIGSAVPLENIRKFMTARHPALSELLRRFGSVQIRNAATLGGNIANASPIGDSPPAMIALGAKLKLRKGGKTRTIPVEKFFLGFKKQDRLPGELIEKILIPVQDDHLRCYKLSKRLDQDISSVCGCFNIAVEKEVVVSARIAFGGMASIPRRSPGTESALLGRRLTPETVSDAQEALVRDFSPMRVNKATTRASTEYRVAAARNLIAKFAAEASQESKPTHVLDIKL